MALSLHIKQGVNVFYEDYFPVNSLEFDPNSRGEAPLVKQLVKIDPAVMVAGVITVDVTSLFGKDKGEVLGVVPLSTYDAANEGLIFKAAAGATAGLVTITINSTDATSTTNLAAFYVFLYGRIFPTDA